MKSMTGYASTEYQDDVFQVSLELKSHNNKYLDINVHLPGSINAMEPELRGIIKTKVSRGYVELLIRFRMLESNLELHVDRQALQRYADAFRDIIAAVGLDDQLRLDHFLQVEEVLKPVRGELPDSSRALITSLLLKLIDDHDAMRSAEGEATLRDIKEQLEGFSEAYRKVADKAGELEQSVQEVLRQRFEELLGSSYDENRILAETAVMLVKYSVNEEIKRIASHLDVFQSILASKGPVGKRLDFLCQELNREINTIASKSTMAEVNQAVVIMKDHLENIREQLRNVE